MHQPFQLHASRYAEKLDYDDIPDDVRSALFRTHAYDPDHHDIYRFCLVPHLTLPEETESGRLPRKLKKRSFAKVDRVLVQVTAENPEIRLVGVHPLSQSADGSLPADVEGEGLFELNLPKNLGKIQLKGITKQLFRRKKKPIVMASRMDDFAQWIFRKPWLSAGREMCMTVACKGSNHLEDHERYLVCDAVAFQRKREIQRLKGALVFLP